MTHTPHVSDLLGSDKHFESIRKPKGHARTFEWWDPQYVEIPGTSFKHSCAPAQHFTGRWMLDQRTLSRRAGPAGLVRPAFAEIRQWFSGCGLAMIPIRGYTSQDGSCSLNIARCKMHIFKDIRAKKAVAIR
ncbi:hypothetical protein EDD85DRAFT_957455 [Armillaria nabsnona]|nr:hypothetical protein EDD85DRAFT_957455 [Armillaria nabsnona]